MKSPRFLLWSCVSPAPASLAAMSNWFRGIGHWLLIGALFAHLGGHQALLQTVAWGNMLVSFSGSDTLAVAAKKTFDGEHPCSLCKVVSESKKQEEKKPALKAESKVDVALPAVIALATPIGVPVTLATPVYQGEAEGIVLGVPTQPPERA